MPTSTTPLQMVRSEAVQKENYRPKQQQNGPFASRFLIENEYLHNAYPYFYLHNIGMDAKTSRH